MKLNFVTLDVFTMTRYKGNPLAIVHIPTSHVSTVTYDQKLRIASEFNLSETVFILEPSDPHSPSIPVNIYLPTTEIPFAGHPTIGTGIYLLHYLSRPIKSITPKAGTISLLYDANSNIVSASIPHSVHLDSHPALGSAGDNNYPSPLFSIVQGMTFALLQLPSLESLAAKQTCIPIPESFDTSHGGADAFRGTKWFVPLGTDEQGRQLLRTRMHGSTISEDAATGSASCALACYLALYRGEEFGGGDGGSGGDGGPSGGDVLNGGNGNRFEFHVVQGVEMGRESHIFVDVVLRDGGEEVESVTLKGTAVKVQEGVIELDL